MCGAFIQGESVFDVLTSKWYQVPACTGCRKRSVVYLQKKFLQGGIGA